MRTCTPPHNKASSEIKGFHLLSVSSREGAGDRPTSPALPITTINILPSVRWRGNQVLDLTAIPAPEPFRRRLCFHHQFLPHNRRSSVKSERWQTGGASPVTTNISSGLCVVRMVALAGVVGGNARVDLGDVPETAMEDHAFGHVV